MKKLIILTILMSTFLVSCGEVVNPGTATVIRSSDGETEVVTKGLAYSWGRDKEYYVNLAPETIPMELQILCGQDAINMKVLLNWTGRFTADPKNPDTIERLVEMAKAKEGETIDLKVFWDRSLDSFAISEAKNALSKVEPDDMNPKREELELLVSQEITKKFLELKYPVETLGVNIVNLDFPDEIDKQRKRIAEARLKDAENAALAKASIAQAEREEGISLAKGKARKIDAEVEALYFKTLADAVDENVLKLRKLETLERISTDLSNSPGSTLVILPFGGEQDIPTMNTEQALMWDAMKRNRQVVAP